MNGLGLPITVIGALGGILDEGGHRAAFRLVASRGRHQPVGIGGEDPGPGKDVSDGAAQLLDSHRRIDADDHVIRLLTLPDAGLAQGLPQHCAADEMDARPRFLPQQVFGESGTGGDDAPGRQLDTHAGQLAFVKGRSGAGIVGHRQAAAAARAQIGHELRCLRQRLTAAMQRQSRSSSTGSTLREQWARGNRGPLSLSDGISTDNRAIRG